MAGTGSRLFVSQSWEALEQKLLAQILAAKSPDPLKPVPVLLGSSLLAQYLERRLYPSLNQAGCGINVEFILFPELVDKLYYADPVPEYRPEAGHWLRFILVRDELRRLGRDNYFGSLKDSPGLAEAMVEEHRDLKDGLVSGDNFTRLKKLAGEKVYPKLGALFGLLEQLDQRLAGYEGRWDRFEIAGQKADRFQQAFATDQLLVYGFYDYTALQRRLIRSLAGQVSLGLFMLRPEGQDDFFCEYQRPVYEDFYQKELGLAPETLAAAAPDSDLGRFKQSLLTGRKSELKADGSLSIVFAPGVEREAVEVCREVMRLVRSRGLKFDEIGVLARDFERYRRPLLDAFEQFQIPCHVVSGRPLSEFGPVKALVRLLRIADPDEDYSRESVVKFLHSRFLRKEIFGPAGGEPAALMDLAGREAGVIKGRDDWRQKPAEYLEALKRSLALAESRAVSGREDEEECARKVELVRAKIKAAETLIEISGALIDELASLQKCAGFSALSEKTGELAGRYLDLDAAPADLGEKLADVLGEIAALDRAGVAADLRTFRELLEKALAASAIKTGKFMQGRVCLSELMAARGARFKAVIVPGLSESSFPLKPAESPLIADDDRAEINRQLSGSGYLAEKWRRTQEERLLFYLACDQAGEHLTLTCPWLDLENSRERPASHLLLNAVSKSLGVEVESDHDKLAKLARPGNCLRWVELSEFSPPCEELALGAEDWESMKTETASSPELYAHLLKTPLVSRIVRLAAERWLGSGLGVFTGFPGQDPGYRPGEFSILSGKVSAAGIKDYLGCPFVYFMKRILAVAPLEEPEKAWGFERLAQGSLVHLALEKLFCAMSSRAQLQDRDQVAKMLREILDRDGDQYLKTEHPSPEPIRKMEIEEIFAYLLRWHEHFLPEPGCKRWQTEKWVEPEAVPLQINPEQKVFLSGKIDRIDFCGERASVIDYKVSKSIESSPLNQVQLPIYLLSVCNMFGIKPENAEAKFVSMVPEKLSAPAEKKITGRKMERHLEGLRTLVRAMAAGIEKGAFAPTARGCDYCDYARGCYATTTAFKKKSVNPLISEILRLEDEVRFEDNDDG